MMTRMKWVGTIALAACVVLTGAWWASAQANDDCNGFHRFGFWGSRHYGGHYGYGGYGYRTYEPGVFAYDGEYRWAEPAYTIRTDEPAVIYDDMPQASAPASEPTRFTETRGMRTRPMKSANIRLAEGNDVGRIEELVISDTGCVDYMIVSFSNMPGLGGRLAAIPWNAGTFDPRTNVVTLDIERDRLYEAPIFFARGTWPALYEGEWASRVHSHFGLDSTRIERAYRARDGESDEEATRNRGGEREEMGDETGSRDENQRRNDNQRRDGAELREAQPRESNVPAGEERERRQPLPRSESAPAPKAEAGAKPVPAPEVEKSTPPEQ
jgi:hypothetical protein